MAVLHLPQQQRASLTLDFVLLLHKRGIWRFGSHWRKMGAQFGISSLAMAIALYLILPYYPADGAQWLRVLALLGICALGAAVYGAVLLGTGFRPRQLKHG